MAKSSMSDQRKADNQRKCGANRQLVFRGAIAKDEIDTFSGKDVVHLILVFSDDLSFRLFTPRESVAKKTAMNETLGSLCKALGTDFDDVPACFGWEDFATTIVDFLAPYKHKTIFAKVTLNQNHWPTYGTGECFSDHPDMEYSEADMTYLDHSEGDIAHSNEGAPPSWDDGLPSNIPF